MTDAPERIWIDPEYIDSKRTAPVLACHLGTANPNRKLNSDTEYTRADVSRAAVEDAYIAGLDAAAAWAKTYFLDAGCTADREHKAGVMIAQTLQVLRNNPAHVRAAVAKLTEGRR